MYCICIVFLLHFYCTVPPGVQVFRERQCAHTRLVPLTPTGRRYKLQQKCIDSLIVVNKLQARLKQRRLSLSVKMNSSDASEKRLFFCHVNKEEYRTQEKMGAQIT